MTPKTIMHRWSGFLQNLLSHSSLWHVQALALFSFAAARAHHCHLSRLAAYAPLAVQPASLKRRLMPLIGNDKLDVNRVCDQMCAWLGRWNTAGARVLLLLDETPQHNKWRVLKVSISYRKRALPLVWRTDALAKRPHRKRVMEVLKHSARLLQKHAPKAQVVLLADRGLCWPEVIRYCKKQGWNYVLRAQSATRLKHPVCTSTNVNDGTGAEAEAGAGAGAGAEVLKLGELVNEPGQFWRGVGQAFSKAGWLEVTVIACFRPGSQESWLLVSDLPPSLHLVRWYARRMWHEQAFRDEKSHGFRWGESQVTTAVRITTAVRMHRLLLILALAQLWLMLLGTWARSGQWRRQLGLHTQSERRRYSVFRWGWILLRRCLDTGELPPCNLAFSPP